MATKFSNNSFISRMSYKKLNHGALRAMLVMLMAISFCNIYAGETWIEATSNNTTAGLVYASTSNATPAISSYTSPSVSAHQSSFFTNSDKTFYIWAKCARGFQFESWSGVGGQAQTPLTSTGNGDIIKSTTPRVQNAAGKVAANFEAAPSYEVVYKQPIGGTYSVEYEYLSIESLKFVTKTETLQVTSTSGDLKPEEGKTYGEDKITLSSNAVNFVAWYKDGVQLSDAKTYSDYRASANATISALFKMATLGEPAGDLSPSVAALGSNNYTITIPVTAHGNWAAGDFNVAFSEQTSPKRNDVTKGEVTYVQESGNVLSSTGILTIPFIYNPTSWGDTEVQVTVIPASGGVYGNPLVFTIRVAAIEPALFEAEIWEIGVKTHEGNLVDMVALANTLTTNPTVRVRQDKTISSPLSLTKSMKFDLNDRTISCTATTAFSIDAEGVDVQIVDEGFLKNGTIAVEKADAGNVSVVTFTKKAKLTMQGGTLSATNTGAGGAHGLDVRQGSVFYMTGGNLTVSAATNARGVNVATASDYATFSGGTITVTAPTNAYGLWSAGQSNITDATVDVKTTTGTTGYGFYINGGVTTLTDVTTSVSVKTAGAGGGFVKAGRLNVNGGSLAVTAETSDVYGVYIAAGATANIQQNAIITAEATSASGTNVFGINNLGTVNLKNISVTATSPTTAATAVNSQTSAVSTTIEGGTYRANTTGGTAYGLHHQYGALTVDGGIFRAIGSGNSIYGGRAIADGTIANATLHGETQGTGNTAYGFEGGVANKNISLINCTIEALSNTSKAYAIYSRANVTATGCTLTATTSGENIAYGLYAENGTNHLTDCDATVKAYTISAYGVYHKAGTLTIDRGTYNVEAKQGTASAAQNSLAYGLYNESGQTTTVNGAAFNTLASNNGWSQNVYGAYIVGTLNSTGGTYTAQGKLNVYGIWGHTASTLNLKENTISSRTTNGATSYGIYAKKNFTIDGDIVSAVGTTTGVYAMFFDATNSVGDVLGGKFSAQGNGTNGYGALNATGTVGKVRLKGGIYKSTVNLQKYTYTGYQVYHLDGTHPDYAAGYRYVIATENPSNYVCRIVGGSYYATLEEALQYTIDNSGSNHTIVMTQHYTLPAGNYRLPSNATLLVPYKFDQTTIAGATPIKINTVGLRENFLCLTLASGANLNADGKIEVGGEMYCQEANQISYNNSPYGRIHMEGGSLIQLNNGAKLYAWGYVTGSGEIKAKSGSEVHEMFQIGDMPTVGNLNDHYKDNSYDYFPINRYCIQNVEAPTTYYYDSQLLTAMSIYYKGMSQYYGDDKIKMIGTSGALFQVIGNDESSWVRKSYDPIHDYQVWDVNSSVSLGSLSLAINTPIGNISMNSVDYILPVASNMKIHVLDGTFAITQSSELIPGASIEVDKTASLNINSGQNLYVFDKDQWTIATTSATAFSPSWTTGSKPSRTINDAAVNVHGNINVLGKFYTSKSIADGTNATAGANIYSNNNDAGTIKYGANAGSGEAAITLMTNATTTKEVTMDPAKLKNGNDSYAETAGTVSGESWVYMNNEWVKTYTNGCFEVIGSTIYAKPSEYVALKKSQTVGGKLTGVAEPDHTYLTAADKILILMDDCQWWEVEETSDPAVFECKKEGYEGFYYYNTSTSKWELKTVNVTFYMKETGTDTKDKSVTVGYNAIPDQSVIATNPTKATTAAATYAFYGWKSSVTGTTYKWTDPLEVATDNMSYRPVFTETPRNYTVTLVNANNGANVPVEVAYNSHPQYTPTKDADAQYTYSFKDWTDNSGNHYLTCDDLPVVTGTATYTANWTKELNVYTVIFKDGEQTLQTKIEQPYGRETSFTGVLPTKEADDEYEYSFDGWVSSQNGTKYANGSTPAVTGDVTYTAHYATTARYFITFANYDGEVLQKEATTVGVHPVYNGTPRRDADRDGYFRFDGWMDGDGATYGVGVELPAVSKKQTYTAQWTYVTTRHTITFTNFDGNGGTWSNQFGEGETPSYDGATPLAKASEHPEQYYYEFLGWNPEIVPVAGPKTYEAQWSEKIPMTYTITFVYDGYGNSIKKEYAYGATPVYGEAGDPTPHKDDVGEYSYPFAGWNVAPFPAVTGDATYTAQFTETQRQYTITFVLDNGEPNVEKLYYKNEIPSIEDPVKATTAEWIYTFVGWSPAIGKVLYNTTYSAQWSQTGVPYNVTFVDEDGTVLKETQVVAHASKPTAPAKDPSKAPSGDTFYTFAGWHSSVNGTTYTTANIPAVGTSDVTYTATYQTMSGVVATVTTAEGNVTPYTSFDEALNVANGSNNCTLKLYQNISDFTAGKTIKGAMTVDFNGYTLSRSASGNSHTTFITITGNPVTFEDSKGGGGLSLTGNGRDQYVATIYVNGGNLTINGGTYYAYNSSAPYIQTPKAYAVYGASGTITINGGNFEAKGNSSKRASISTIYNASVAPTINGGKFKSSGGKTINNLSNAGKCLAKGGYYTHDTNVGLATGYKIVATTEETGYNYKVVLKEYTITYKDGDNKTIGTEQVKHGSMPTKYSSLSPTKKSTSEYSYTFNRTWEPEIIAAKADATYTAQFDKTKKITNLVVNDEEVINENTKAVTTTVKVSGNLTIENGSTLTTTNLILEAAANNSGTIDGIEYLTVNGDGDVYFDYEFNTDPWHWSAFGVPFEINLDEFAPLKEKDPNQPMVLGTDYDIVYYNTANRAAKGIGKKSWEYVEYHTHTLTPGTLYMIAFNRPVGHVNVVRFKKATTAAINYTDPVSLTITGSGTDDNWNGIANPKMYHALLSAGVEECQVHDGGPIGSDGYTTYTMHEGSTYYKFFVGKAAFVQVPSSQSEVEIDPADNESPIFANNNAPRRAMADRSERHEVLLTSSNGETADRLYILAEEDKADEYVIVSDLSKMGVSPLRAQMWVDRYGQKLCKNTTALMNDKADYPLGISVPQAEEVEIRLADSEDADPSAEVVYLTYDGQAIWNLSYAPYIASLETGTTANYGLRIVVNRAPQVATGIDEAVVDANGDIRKVLIDEKVYVIRGGQVYSIDGQLVKY